SPSGAGASDEEAAVQTLLDYFDAINQQDYGSVPTVTGPARARPAVRPHRGLPAATPAPSG
ncbi:MAG: hypothetical protein M1337_07120, partial [Actinobacteria bacterium]|nr:hypothetical protein [Actinomycetota bacterium]